MPREPTLQAVLLQSGLITVNIVVKDVQDQVIPSIQWIGAVITTTSATLKKNVTKRTAPAPTTSSSALTTSATPNVAGLTGRQSADLLVVLELGLLSRLHALGVLDGRNK
ncbi:hypothetical protein Ndes2437A_g04824 [Nannochloris sp. 'desiccata']